MRSLGFGVRDLDANRDGKLSPSQIDYLKHRRNLIIIIGPFTAFLLWSTAVFCIVLTGWWIALVIVAFTIPLTIFWVRGWKKFHGEALEARAESIQGCFN